MHVYVHSRGAYIARLLYRPNPFHVFVNKICLNQEHLSGVRLRMFRAYVWSVLLHGYDSWTLCPKVEKRLMSVETRFTRWMQNINWKEYATNKEWQRSRYQPGQVIRTVIKN